MSFQIKNFVSITAAMLNHIRGVAPQLSDLNVGSVARTLVEAPAIEIEEAYQQAFNGLREAIPVATYESFNFGRLLAAPATGVLTVTVAASAEDVVIAEGAIFNTAASRTTYISQAAATIPAGQSIAQVSVVAAEAGILGNLPANSAFTPTGTIPNFVSATNAQLFSNGRNVESDDERKQRFVAYIGALQRATLAAVEYGAKTVARYNNAGVEIERVASVSIIEPYLDDPDEPISLVNVYIHNGVGDTSGDLVQETAKVLHGYVDGNGQKVAGWKAAGVKMVVAAAEEEDLDVEATITAQPGYVLANLVASAEDIIGRYILSLGVGESFIMSHLVVLVSEVPGVANIVFADPAGDVTVTRTQKLMPGVLDIS